MKNCDKFKDLIEKYLDGMIAEDELSELQKHTEACPSCRAEFERSTFMEDAVRQAFTSQTSAEDAGTSLMDRLGEMWDSSVRQLNVSGRIERLKESASNASEQIINLIVIFVLQTIILPLAFLWLVVEGLKAIAGRATFFKSD